MGNATDIGKPYELNSSHHSSLNAVPYEPQLDYTGVWDGTRIVAVDRDRTSIACAGAEWTNRAMALLLAKPHAVFLVVCSRNVVMTPLSTRQIHAWTQHDLVSNTAIELYTSDISETLPTLEG
jgi:hypothetical protein